MEETNFNIRDTRRCTKDAAISAYVEFKSNKEIYYAVYASVYERLNKYTTLRRRTTIYEDFDRHALTIHVSKVLVPFLQKIKNI